MRPIKFRAWDKSENRWIENGWMMSGTKGTVASNMPDDYIVMQFTGLHDKNGKEIYEGDILNVRTRNKSFKPGQFGSEKWSDYHEYKVEVYVEPGMWLTRWSNGNYHTHLVTVRSNTEEASGSIEVIGNVWENPDLIKSV